MKIKENYPKILLLIYLLIWTWAAINPNYRSVWIDENILPLVFLPILILTYKKFRFSNLSYTLIFIFMVLHAIGGHYSYSEVPLFEIIKDNYGLARNHYDRFVHFMFGFLFFLPIHEILTKIFLIPKDWRGKVLTLFIIIGIKECFEMLEYGYTAIRNNSLTFANYLGEQGDSLDSIKDVTMGTFGALISMTISLVRKR